MGRFLAALLGLQGSFLSMERKQGENRKRMRREGGAGKVEILIQIYSSHILFCLASFNHLLD
jgi:hypothetical protein